MFKFNKDLRIPDEPLAKLVELIEKITKVFSEDNDKIMRTKAFENAINCHNNNPKNFLKYANDLLNEKDESKFREEILKD